MNDILIALLTLIFIYFIAKYERSDKGRRVVYYSLIGLIVVFILYATSLIL